MKRYNHFNTTTHDKKCNAILLTSSPTMHHITLPQDERYNHFNTTIYHTGQERGYKALSISIAPHIALPQDERTTTNNIFIPERPRPIKCRTIYHR